MAISDDVIVTHDGNLVVGVINVSTCLSMLPLSFYYNQLDVVEMIKQFPENVPCWSLAFHSDVVYIGSTGAVIKWNVVSDKVLRLQGYPDGLNSKPFCTALYDIILCSVG